MDGKVTALVVRAQPAGAEILLFQHPYAGIQIPAGTIEPGEAPAAAALREAFEETGLAAFAGVQPLGYRDEVAPDDLRMIVRPATVYSRPDAGSFDWTRIRTGITVRQEREANGFAQITYEEWERAAEPPHVSYRITGWTPTTNLATAWRRHFFLLRHDQATPERWEVETDHHRFTLFWAPLASPPAIWPPQDTWLTMLPPELRPGAAR
jgi:8-oxo-dGTP pyrophosphatase MutT (NUDIX family)